MIKSGTRRITNTCVNCSRACDACESTGQSSALPPLFFASRDNPLDHEEALLQGAKTPLPLQISSFSKPASSICGYDLQTRGARIPHNYVQRASLCKTTAESV